MSDAWLVKLKEKAIVYCTECEEIIEDYDSPDAWNSCIQEEHEIERFVTLSDASKILKNAVLKAREEEQERVPKAYREGWIPLKEVEEKLKKVFDELEQSGVLDASKSVDYRLNKYNKIKALYIKESNTGGD